MYFVCVIGCSHLCLKNLKGHMNTCLQLHIKSLDYLLNCFCKNVRIALKYTGSKIKKKKNTPTPFRSDPFGLSNLFPFSVESLLSSCIYLDFKGISLNKVWWEY